MSRFKIRETISTCLLMTVFLLLAGPTAYATTLIYKSFEKVTGEAKEIFEGEVISQSSELSEGGKTIYTYVTIAITEPLKGNTTDSTKTLKFEGGCVGDDCLLIPGMPTFEVGERVILFEKQNITSRTLCPIVGWVQGKFSVEIDAGSGEEVIRDGLGKKIIGFNEEKGELIKERSQSEHPVPIPVDGTSDQLVSQASPLKRGSELSLSKDAFKAKIREIVEKQLKAGISLINEPVKSSSETQIGWEAVPAPEVTQ